VGIGGAVTGAVGGTGSALLDPLLRLWMAFIDILPGLVLAVILLIFGYIIAAILGYVVRVVLERAGLDTQVKKARLTKAIGTTRVSPILGELTKWYIFIIFLGAAVDQLRLGTISFLLQRLVFWLPDVIAAILIMLVGLFLAYFVEMKVLEHSSMKGTGFTAKILRWVIIVIAIIIALNQIGIDVSLLENTYLLVLGALAVGFALAFGIGFGLGFKKEAEGLIAEIRKSI